MVNLASYMHALNPVETIPGHFQREPGTMNVTMSKHKMILLLKFACNTNLGLKKLVARLKNDNFHLQN